MPVKRYSSGMYARLGFAVAAHTDPDILLVDEVLAVGDWNFQQKCFDFIHSFVKSGKTTIFVSHNLYAAEQLCDRLIWLEKGIIQQKGFPTQIVQQYLEFLEDQIKDNKQIQTINSNKLQIKRVWLSDENSKEKNSFSMHQPMIINIEYFTIHKIRYPYFCIWISAV